MNLIFVARLRLNIFDYHYQSAVLSYDDIQRLYYYMMKMMFRGVDEPDVTIGELISTV